ncbi:MAG TPA: preprotein translocase subunit SecG [Sphingomicrobium sp.]|nr:preprotein translocase subunit SecG [Sphingomicrobium sp.]
MFTFLLILQALVAASLVGSILMQRSEGGGLGVGGSSSGFMTARGAADFLTRTTAILAAIFIANAIVLAAIAGVSREPAKIDTTLANQVAPPTGVPVVDEPTPQQPEQQAPAQQQPPAVPLAQ